MTWFDKVRLYLIYTVAVSLIVLAVAFSALRAVLPYATGYADDVEQAFSEKIGLPVSIASIDADMYWLVPRLKLVDVVIYDKGKQRELLRLDEAFIALAFVDSLLQWQPAIGDVSLVGADLYVERHADNRWRIQGVEFSGEAATTTVDSSSKELLAAIQSTNFSLLDSNIHWQDFSLNGRQLDFIGANIFIEEFFGDHSLELNIQLPNIYGESLQLIIKTDADVDNLVEADFDFYLQAVAINIEQSLSVLNISDLPKIKGVFSGEFWLSRKNEVFSKAVLDASFKQLSVKHSNQNQFSLDNVRGKFEWQKTDDGWYFNSRDIHLTKNKVAWTESSSVSVVKDEAGLSLAATYLRSQDLVEIAKGFLSNDQLDLLEKYQLSNVSGDIYNLSASIPVSDSESISLSSAFENLNFNIPDSDILFRGMDGFISYSDNKASLEILSENVEMDFGSLFRQPLKADLFEAELLITRDSNDWHIYTDDLYLLNSDLEINTRLKLLVNEQGEIFSDIQVDFNNVIGASLHKYYPVSAMSNDLVEWLDMSISDGFVESGSFIIHGDFNNFPYASNDGVMQVVFDTRYLTLQFLEGWPSLNNLSSHIRFHNASLLMTEVSGETYRGKMLQTEATIEDLNAPRLFVNGRVHAPAEDLQQYVWNSGLDSVLGNAMNAFQANGETKLELQVEVPLDNDDAVMVKGVLQLDGNELYLPVLDYTLKDVSGDFTFQNGQLVATSIQADFENSPININVYTKQEQKNSEIIFSINGRFPVDGLFRKLDWIPEAWLVGDSDWNMEVHFPDQKEDYFVCVEMNSNLQGTNISLSDAVSKSKDELLPINIEIKAVDDALQVDVKSEGNFSLFATRDDELVWDFVVDSRLIRGSGEFSEDLNKDSTAFLDLEYIDLLTLFKSSKKSNDALSLKPDFFPSLNFKSKKLLWDDWKFSDVKLDSSWHSHGMLINSISLHGPSLKINGRGSWLSSWQHEHQSNFKLFVNSSDLGNTMSSLKLSDAMQGGVKTATIDWQWFDEPYRFSWQTVQGSSHFQLKNGVVTELDPGTSGRIVGLLNVFKLFDRLTLDFKDVASDGFAYDLIEGDFKFHDGLATSSNIEVAAAAADMRLRGDIGMVDQNYDLVMQVKPRSSAAAFTTGALAGGPILGAGLVLLNKLLGLEKSAYDEYKITGPWRDPLVEQIEKRETDEIIEEDE